MSTLIVEEPSQEFKAPAGPVADTLAASVVILLVMTVAQRFIGFGRGIMFCRWLEPEELGQWDVAFAFLNLAAAVAVLGLQGSFGRYVEYFRHRGQIRTFLRRTTIASVVMCIVATVSILLVPHWFSQLIFGTPDETRMVVWIALCLATIIIQNHLVALFIALRMYRIVTVLQFVQGVGFALLSLAVLGVRPSGATTIIVAFGLATIVSSIGAAICLKRLVWGDGAVETPVRASAFWAKLLPFAIGIWVMNLLANLFEVVDRYMLVHHSGMEVGEALRQVGFYHSSRLIPLLFVAIANLLGLMVTPHLSADWEMGRRDAVVRRLNMVLKCMLLAMFAASVATLCIAPFLFGVAFHNKFQGGLVVLPWTLAYCTWFGTIAVAQNYLQCAERPGLTSFALLAGLLVNIAIDLLILPHYGLIGAVWSTTLANVVALLLVYRFSRQLGMEIDSGTWILSLAPITLVLGFWPALAMLAVLCGLIGATDLVVIPDEWWQLMKAYRAGCEKFRGWRRLFPRLVKPASISN